MLGKAAERGLVRYQTHNIRDSAADKHRTTDDTPYGGGDGMLLKADVLYMAWRKVMAEMPAAICAEQRAAESGRVEFEGFGAGTENSNVGNSCAGPQASRDSITILLSPQGPKLDATRAKRLATYRKIVLVCGHYEGVDERFIDLCVDEELSIGDYVLTGGELAALVTVDAVVRWIPGVVGKERSVSGDSLENGLLKYPQYTRPREFLGVEVPAILLSGDHAKIAAWRSQQSEERTARKRPDLLQTAHGSRPKI